MEDYITKFNEMNPVLIKYGWIPSPYLMGCDFNKLHNLCMSISDNKELDKETSKTIIEEINHIMTTITFSPEYRAFYVVRAKELPHISKFSHYIERAIIHYYKQDYLSCTLCLLPAIEGVLLSYMEWDFDSNKKKPRTKDLINFIKNRKITGECSERYELYSNTLANFLNKWIFNNTDNVEFEICSLNRHYALHGMGDKHFYSIENCHRLILFFDLFIELLSIENKMFYGFIPNDNVEINKRSDYYLEFIYNNDKYVDMIKKENRLMLENQFFIEEKNVPNLDLLNLEHVIKMKNIVSKMGIDKDAKLDLFRKLLGVYSED